jgi:hypothetical protein
MPRRRKRWGAMLPGMAAALIAGWAMKGAISGEQPSTDRHRSGLRKLSPELIGKARDETAAQVTRILLTFVGAAALCVLSLLSPDSALLGGSDRVNVPLAGPVSF